MHDLVIKNAVLVDGVGTPAFEGEIAVTGGKISAKASARGGQELMRKG